MFTFSVSHQTTCLGYQTNALHFVTATPTVSMTCFPSSASASSCSSSSTSHLASPPVCSLFLLFLLFLCLHLINEAGLLSVSFFYHFVQAFFLSFVLYISVLSLFLQQSLAEVQHLRAKALASPTQEATGFLLKDSSGGGGSSKNSSSCDTDDFVMVPPHFTSKKAKGPYLNDKCSCA